MQIYIDWKAVCIVYFFKEELAFMSNKNFRKYTVTTMAAAMAATSVVPVVASADTTFSDVSDSNVHHDNIMELVDRDVIQGYENGNFGPYDSITRGQVAVMLTKALELPIPEDIDSVLEQYTDVNSGDRYAKEVAAVTAAGVFKGNDGEFDRYANMSRQQMATVLVEGFGLKDYDNGKDVEVNFDNISASHADNVQIIANLGITSQPQDYRGYEDVSRGQFSTFLVKTLNLTEDIVVNKVEGVEGQIVDNSSDEPQFLDFTINDGKELTIEELEEAGYDIEFLTSKDVLSNADDAQANELTKDKLAEAGDSFTYQVRITKDGEEVALSEHVTVEVEDFSTALTDVTTIVPVVNGQEKGSYVVTEGDKLSFNVYGHLKNNPEKEVNVTHLVDSVESSKLTVLYPYEDKTAEALKSGEVTVTVKIGDKTATQQVTVVDEENAPTVDSLSADVESVQLVSGDSETIKVIVRDQYGDLIVGEPVTSSLDEDVATLNKTSETDSDGTAEFTLTGASEGTATLTLTAGEETVEIPVEVIEAGDVDYYALSGEEQFDLAESTTQGYTLEGYDEQALKTGDQINLPTEGNIYYEVESTDDSVAEAAIENNEVVVTGKQAGTVTVTLSKFEGTLATPTETYTKEITVEDSRAKLIDITFAEADKLPDFTSDSLTAELSEIVTELTFLPETTAYKFVQGEDDAVIKIIDTNDEVDNNLLGTIDVRTGSSEHVEVTIAPKEDDKQEAIITVDSIDETTAVETPLVLTVKDADGNEIDDIALSVNLEVADNE